MGRQHSRPSPLDAVLGGVGDVAGVVGSLTGSAASGLVGSLSGVGKEVSGETNGAALASGALSAASASIDLANGPSLLSELAVLERRVRIGCSAEPAWHTAQRAAAEHVNVGPTSTLELTCDAVTTGTLSAGDLGRCGELAHLLCPCCADVSQ